MTDKPKSTLNIHGIIPARMSAKRFPGKPLFPIHGTPMIKHVYDRAREYPFTTLSVATPDMDIADYCTGAHIPVIGTRDDHERALDRVAEAAKNTGMGGGDIVVCVQGDEPMITKDLLARLIDPLLESIAISCTVLTMKIDDLATFYDPDIVKAVCDVRGDILYTSRAPIPYMEEFDPDIAIRIGGMFAFRHWMLNWFTQATQSPIEILESCDSNRICGHGRKQRAVIVEAQDYFSVDRLKDIAIVERAMRDQ